MDYERLAQMIGERGQRSPARIATAEASPSQVELGGGRLYVLTS